MHCVPAPGTRKSSKVGASRNRDVPFGFSKRRPAFRVVENYRKNLRIATVLDLARVPRGRVLRETR